MVDHHSQPLNKRTRRRLRALQERDGLECYICNKVLQAVDTILVRPIPTPKDFPTIDHIIPRSKGGLRCSVDNQKIACSSCNGEKADAMPEERKQENA
jgi:5-methylcytosine-specific restriction endonuclease McrA